MVLKSEFSDKQRAFAEKYDGDIPLLVMDTDRFRQALDIVQTIVPGGMVCPAIKCCPHEDLVAVFAKAGCGADCASLGEIKLAIKKGVPLDKICFGNTIKSEDHVKEAIRLGVRRFAIDSYADIEALTKHKPAKEQVEAFCRVMVPPVGKPLKEGGGGKNGCSELMAIDLLKCCDQNGILPAGVSYHIGAQQKDPSAWDLPFAIGKRVFNALDYAGIQQIKRVNLGGSIPSLYDDTVPSPEAFRDGIANSKRRVFGDEPIELMVEPGRSVFGGAGVMVTKILTMDMVSYQNEPQRVALNVGRFHGLFECDDIQYPLLVLGKEDGPTMTCKVVGPSCDGSDQFKGLYELSQNTAAGDKVIALGTGAYSWSYRSWGFNHIPSAECRVI